MLQRHRSKSGVRVTRVHNRHCSTKVTGQKTGKKDLRETSSWQTSWENNIDKLQDERVKGEGVAGRHYRRKVKGQASHCIKKDFKKTSSWQTSHEKTNGSDI